jgi:HD-like signal output (HDOD) protein
VEYANVLNVAVEYSFDLLHCERELFDIDHCQAGAWLAEQWKLPAELATIAAHHHDEPTLTYANQPPDLLLMVRLACRLADLLDFSVVKARQSMTVEQILEYLPEAARIRFPTDMEALKVKVTQRVQTLS